MRADKAAQLKLEICVDENTVRTLTDEGDQGAESVLKSLADRLRIRLHVLWLTSGASTCERSQDCEARVRERHACAQNIVRHGLQASYLRIGSSAADRLKITLHVLCRHVVASVREHSQVCEARAQESHACAQRVP
jgi:hypothetical protein